MPIHKIKNTSVINDGCGLCIIVLSSLLISCGQMPTVIPNHQDRVGSSVESLLEDDPASALAKLEQKEGAQNFKPDVLFLLEKGELSFINKKYELAIQNIEAADTLIRKNEDTQQTQNKLKSMAAAALISEKLKDYPVKDYEKVMTNVRLAQAKIAMQQVDEARVDIKRSHEREAMIEADIAKKEEALHALKTEAKTDEPPKVLDGYPVDTINSPEVLALKNGYQNAFSHYLSGYLYEAMGEPGLAAAGYRKAIELGGIKSDLDESLAKLDSRMTNRGSAVQTDVLIIFESGSAPQINDKTFTLPIPTPTGINTITISYPVIYPAEPVQLPKVNLGGADALLIPVTNFNAMARRTLKDEMPGVITRIMTRGAAKGLVQDQLSSQLGIAGSLIGAAGAMATEGVDDRSWQTLPEQIAIARVRLPPGTHDLVVDGKVTEKIEVGGAYMILPARLLKSSFRVGTVTTIGKLRVKPQESPSKPGKKSIPAKKINKKKKSMND